MPDFDKILRHGRRTIKDTTINKYVMCLKTIQRDVFQNRWNDKYLNDTETIIELLKEKYPNASTLNNFASALIVYIKCLPEITPDTLKTYQTLLSKTNQTMQEKYSKQQKTEKEDENWMSLAEIKGLRDQRFKEAQKETRRRQKIDLYQQYLVLSLYTKLPPVRNDYANVRIVSQNEGLTNDSNYIHLGRKKVLFCNYKTAKSYGTREFDLPDEIVQDITRFIELRGPLAHDFLLVNINDLSRMTKNGLTQYMKKIFYPKKISSSMLRKIYLSEKYPVVHTYDEAEFDSQFMGHSMKTQQMVYRKKNTLL